MEIPIVPEVAIDDVVYSDDDELYRDPVLRTRYYNFYWSYGAFFRPSSVYEIGVRYGYTGYFILAGASGSVGKYRGIDIESYRYGSNARAEKLLRRVCPDVQIYAGSSHDLRSLGGQFDLIHVDGDHSYEGKIADLELAWASVSSNGVIVVDDCYDDAGPKSEVLRATQDFIFVHNAKAMYHRNLCGSRLNPLSGHVLLQRP